MGQWTRGLVRCRAGLVAEIIYLLCIAWAVTLFLGFSGYYRNTFLCLFRQTEKYSWVIYSHLPPSLLVPQICSIWGWKGGHRVMVAFQHSLGAGTQNFSPTEVWDDHFGYREKFRLDNLITWDVLQADLLLHVMPTFPLTVTQTSN